MTVILMKFPDFFSTRFVKHHLIHRTHQNSHLVSLDHLLESVAYFLILSDGLALMMEDQQIVGTISTTLSNSHNL